MFGAQNFMRRMVDKSPELAEFSDSFEVRS
jgi:hypothetical protein